MNILIYADHHNGKFPKSTLEAIHYGAQLAKLSGGQAIAFVSGNASTDALGNAGADVVLTFSGISNSDSQQLTRVIVAAAKAKNANIVVFSHDLAGKLVAPRVAARMNAGIIPGAISLPSDLQNFQVKKNVFSGKAIAEMALLTENKVITVLPNSLGVAVYDKNATVEAFSADPGQPGIQVKEVRTESGDGEIPLPEAELVVSGGRGMKGPEFWQPIVDLAHTLGAATACSRPVADIGWRPHHEHVGQTGITIRPNLYIAIGISGAIQHLAGVNGSKVIVVINKDPEAPFFKAADYGIVGDAFEVLPKIIDAAKAFKANA
jgi:electron transfer flavoprotein alpha subunit